MIGNGQANARKAINRVAKERDSYYPLNASGNNLSGQWEAKENYEQFADLAVHKARGSRNV